MKKVLYIHVHRCKLNMLLTKYKLCMPHSTSYMYMLYIIITTHKGIVAKHDTGQLPSWL